MNLYAKNLLLMPLMWGTGNLAFAHFVCGLEVTWWLYLAFVFCSTWGDLLDYAFEKRPLQGPYRWKERTHDAGKPDAE